MSARKVLQVFGRKGAAEGELRVGREWTKHRVYDYGYRTVNTVCIAVGTAGAAWMVGKGAYYYFFRRDAVRDTVLTLTQQRVAERQAQAEQELLSGKPAQE